MPLAIPDRPGLKSVAGSAALMRVGRIACDPDVRGAWVEAWARGAQAASPARLAVGSVMSACAVTASRWRRTSE